MDALKKDENHFKKKLIKYRERNEVQRWLFQRELQKYDLQKLYWMDECGIEHRLYREYARAPRGERVYESISGSGHKRTSVISASQGSRLVCPMLFEGACTSNTVNAYFEKVLLPELPEGAVIVLDNARFHQSPETLELVKRFKCELLFFPAYSPDLNPIEHIWATLKKLLRPKLSFRKNKTAFIAKMSLSLC